MCVSRWIVGVCAACWLLVVVSGDACAQAGGDHSKAATSQSKKTVAGKKVDARKKVDAGKNPFTRRKVDAHKPAVGKIVVTPRKEPRRTLATVDGQKRSDSTSVVAERVTDLAGRARIEAALDANIRCAFDQTPLCDVADYFQQTQEIPIVIDKRALDEIGITPATPVRCQLNDVSLRSALYLVLRPLQLTYRITGGLLMITTPEEAEGRLEICVYPAGDLANRAKSSLLFSRDKTESYDNLIDLIMSIVAVDTWAEVGGLGAIEVLPNAHALIVSQTREVQHQVACLLHTLRQVRSADAGKAARSLNGVPVLPSKQHAAEVRIQKQLTKTVRLEFDETPLSEVAAFIRQTFQVPVVVDRAGLDEVGLTTDTPVTSRVNGVSLRVALELMLNELQLTYVVTNEVLLITTPEVCEEELKVRVYPVADLVRTADQNRLDYDSLIRTVTSTVAPDSWDEVGGAGAIEPFVLLNVLVIAQDDRIHEKIDNLFAALRSAKSRVAVQNQGPVPEQNVSKLDLRTYSIIGKPEQAQQLAKTIRALVLPSAWGNGADTATIQVFGSRLLIRQTQAGHRMVCELIDELGVSSGMGRAGMDGWGGGMGGMGRAGSVPQGGKPKPGATGAGGMF